MALEEEQNANKHNIYLIVRSLKGIDGKSQRGYALSPGHVIKLGRIEYRVIEIKGQKEGSEELEVKKVSGSAEDDSCFDADKQEYPEGTERICRYCLIEEEPGVENEDINNALLFPCKCSGSAGGVHFQCLKNWIKHKIISKASINTATYAWKKLECEVCKNPLPRNFKFKGQTSELITVERPPVPYIILEKVNSLAVTGTENNKKSSSLSLIVPDLDNKEVIRLGRGHQCDLRISDISVSRVHAHLKYIDGKFLILDNESKFGTLILLGKNYKIKDEKAAIQIGRTVVTFVKKYYRPNGYNRDRRHNGGQRYREDGAQRVTQPSQETGSPTDARKQ